MVLFDEYQTAHKYNAGDMTLAVKLREAVRTLKPHIRPNMDAWAHQMGILTRRHGAAEVTNVVFWYAANIGRERMYRGHSAGAFKNKYEDIRKWMKDEEKPDVPRTPAVEKMLKKVGQMGWPTQPHDLEHTVLEHFVFWQGWQTDSFAYAKRVMAAVWPDYTAYQTTFDDARAYTDEEKRPARIYTLAKRIPGDLEHLGGPEQLCQWWFGKFNDDVAGWADWNGRIPKPTIDKIHLHPIYKKPGSALARWVGGIKEFDENYTVQPG